MTGIPNRATLETITRIAVQATNAARGRLVAEAPGSESPLVVTAYGGDAAWSGSAPGALAGYVMATGQPQVVTHRPGGEAWQTPASLLCVPCIWDDEVVGALELQDKAGGRPFSVDDLELAGLLGAIAGVGLSHGQARLTPDPASLIGDLTRLAAADATRYATIAQLVASLLHA